MAKRTTVFDLWSQKGKKKWPQTHIDTAKEAEAAYKAGIEIISCEPDHHFNDVRKVAPTAFLSVGLKHGLVSSPQEAIKKGFEKTLSNFWPKLHLRVSAKSGKVNFEKRDHNRSR